MTHPFTPGSSICAYLRDSGGNRQELSVAQQEERIRAWCAENDLILSRIFTDIAQSGGSTVGREQLDAMLKHFEQQPPDAGVVFWDYSRWARNYDDGQYMLSLLRRRGYLVHSLEETIPTGPTGKIVESLHLWSAEQYREQLSKNVKRGLAYVIANHHAYPRRNAPLGYRRVPVEIGSRRDGTPHIVSQIEPDPVTAPLVQKAFAMRAGGASIREIHLATGFKFKSTKSYRYLFTNRIYIGIFDFGENSYPGFCEPLIDPATWQAVQQVSDAWQMRRGAAHPRRATSIHLLTGLLHCNRCGSLMYGKLRNKKTPRGVRQYWYYNCGMSKNVRSLEIDRCQAKVIRAEQLNEHVFTILKNKVLRKDVLELAYSEARARQAVLTDEHNAVLITARRDLAGLNAAIDRILAAIADTGHSRALLTKLTELEHERDKAQLQVIDAETQAASPLPDLDIDALVREGLGILEQGEFRQKQLFLRSFIREIRVEWVNGEFLGGIDLILPGGDRITIGMQET